MPVDPDAPPQVVQADLLTLRGELDDAIPAKELDRNLLIGTWNIRAFGGLTEKWASGPGDTPKRDLHALRCIADIVARFDVVALQEVKGNIKALRHMMKLLGPDWGMILTDVNRGRLGNDERMAFVFDLRRVRPSGLAGELVVPEEWTEEIADVALTRQFARSPYAVSFISAKRTFILVTLHVIFGQDRTERVKELRAIARWMADWAGEISTWGHNLIVLGDFNIDRHGDPSYEAFTSTGLCPPPELFDVPRTIFATDDKAKFYDQIAWFSKDGVPQLALRYNKRAGYFDFVDVVMKGRTKTDLSWRISDHFPLWTEFLIRDE